MRSWIFVFAFLATAKDVHKVKVQDVLDIWNQIPQVLTSDMLHEALLGIQNVSQVNAMLEFVERMNATYNHSAILSFAETGEGDSVPNTAQYSPIAGNPHCDIDMTGPKMVTSIIPAQKTNNVMNNIPQFGFDLTTKTNEMLQSSPSSQGASSTSAGLVQMMGIMMVKNLIQSTISTGVSIVPPAIPPPVWNLMPLPCVPLINAPNCFGAVMYPITFADAISSDMVDSLLTSTIHTFRSTFRTRAGEQPDSVYQGCFKAYMSMMCSTSFPMCTNPQGRDEMIPFIGRVPMCFMNCINVLMKCPGFGFADVAGPCSEISIPPICSQAIYLKDDLLGQQTIEDELEGKLNSKCHDYSPEVDAGEDPYLYEEEPAEKLFHSQHDMQSYIR